VKFHANWAFSQFNKTNVLDCYRKKSLKIPKGESESVYRRRKDNTIAKRYPRGNHNPSRSWLITGFVTRLTRRVSLVEQELLTLPEHLSSPPVFSGVCVSRYLVLCACFVDRCLSFCPFYFGPCVVCRPSIYEFLLPLVYLQNIPETDTRMCRVKTC
jgi:hypothetical protein